MKQRMAEFMCHGADPDLVGHVCVVGGVTGLRVPLRQERRRRALGENEVDLRLTDVKLHEHPREPEACPLDRRVISFVKEGDLDPRRRLPRRGWTGRVELRHAAVGSPERASSLLPEPG